LVTESGIQYLPSVSEMVIYNRFSIYKYQDHRGKEATCDIQILQIQERIETGCTGFW
jgi:hypothetical protein